MSSAKYAGCVSLPGTLWSPGNSEETIKAALTSTSPSGKAPKML